MKSYYYILFIFTFILFGCKKEATVWDTDWSVPLISDRLDLNDLVNDSTLESNGVGGYNVVLSRNLIDLALEDFVAIPDTTIEKAITIVFPSLNVPPGFTISNSAEENDISIADLELKNIHVKSGKITFHVQNPVGTGLEFTVSLPGTTYNGGATFVQSYHVPAATGSGDGTTSQTFDLSGYSFDLTGLNHNKNNLFVSQINVTSDPNGPTVTMTNNDSIKFFVEFQDVKLDYARGYFGQTIVSDTIVQTLGALNAYQSGVFDIPSLNLDLSIINGIKVGARATLSSLKSTNNLGNTVSLSHPQIGNAINIDPATGSWSSLNPSVNTLSFNSSNSNIESFIENLGNDYSVGFQLDLNPYGNISGGWDELFPNSKLTIRTDLNMPLQAGMDQLVLLDTFDIDINNEQLTNIQEGSFVLKTKNSFPISANVSLRFLNKNGGTLFMLNGTHEIKSSLTGSIDPSIGLFVSDDLVLFELNSNQIASLQNAYSIIAKIELNTPDPTSGTNTMVDIPFGAFIDLQLNTQFTLRNKL